MKKQLLFFIVLLSSITGFSQCNYSFVMSSTGTTGWNGNTMNVRQNGVTVATIGSTFTSGSGPVTVVVPLQDNTPFTLFWNSGGTLPSQVRVSIKNSFGQTIYTKPAGSTQNILLYSATTNCTYPICPTPTSFSAGSVTNNSATLSWGNDPSITQWEVLVLPQTSPGPITSDSGTITTTNSFFTSGLTCNTAYKSYVRPICTPSAPTTWFTATTAAFTTLNCNIAPTTMCTGANSLCGTFGNVYANTTGVASQGAMGCLMSSPNATWFYFSVDTPGQINLEIKQSTLADMSTADLDVDYVIYGPYSQIIAPCNGQLTPEKIVSCSYST